MAGELTPAQLRDMTARSLELGYNVETSEDGRTHTFTPKPADDGQPETIKATGGRYTFYSFPHGIAAGLRGYVDRVGREAARHDEQITRYLTYVRAAYGERTVPEARETMLRVAAARGICACESAGELRHVLVNFGRHEGMTALADKMRSGLDALSDMIREDDERRQPNYRARLSGRRDIRREWWNR